MENIPRLGSILDNFSGKKILVIGDLMLDRYIYGEVSRISPEAPVPIVRIERDFYNLGGAGNVASNISSLGGKVFLFSFVGKDEEAEILKKLLDNKKIDYFLDNNSLTTIKTRIIGKGQQIVRLDKEDTSNKIFKENIKEKLLEKAEEADSIVISDYAKGVVTESLMSLLNNYRSKIIVDPKPKNKSLFKGVFLITPNEKEALEMSNHSNVYEAIEKLKEELNSNILITRGEKGMMLFSDKKSEIPTFAREVFDVSGAGDSVMAALSLAISANASLEEASIIANYTAGIAVEKIGTYSVNLNELKNRILFKEKKIVGFEELEEIISDYKKKKKKIIWTNGCFDLLHSGHVKLLDEAKKLGDILIVGLDSDESVKKLKGNSRPIQSEAERAEILSSIEYVDYVIVFPEGTVEKYLEELKPDIYIKGGDYNLETINQNERKIIESYGGRITFIPISKNSSTSDIISKIRKDLINS